MRPTVQQIQLDGRPVLRLMFGPYLVGYFSTIQELIDALPGWWGINLNEVEIR